MDQLLNYVLTQILIHGYPIIFFAIVSAYFGVPIPLNAVLLAAGAFTVDRTLSLFILIPLITVTAIIGDIFGYFLGKRFGYVLVNKYTAKLGLTEKRLAYTDKFFNRWGKGSVFFSRWLLTPLGIPVNVIAGIHAYSFKKFLLWAALGEIIWASLYVGLGSYFGANWVSLLDYVNDAPMLFTSVILGTVFLFIGLTALKK